MRSFKELHKKSFPTPNKDPYFVYVSLCLFVKYRKYLGQGLLSRSLERLV